MVPGSAERDGTLDFLAGGGDMGALMRSKDWSTTPIGDPSTWPQSLRTAISMCLNSRFPMFIWWGPELVSVYNDGYIPMLGDKHPASLGARGSDVWAEIWDVIGPMLDTVRRDGTATWSEDQLLLMTRAGYEEETYFTFSYSPVIEESGGVGGIFCAVTETTGRVIGERRLRTLAAIGAGRDSTRGDPNSVGRAALAALATNPSDVPFAQLRADHDDGSTEGVGSSGLADAVETITLDLDTGGRHVNWVLELGISPRRAFDDDYRQFFTLVAAAVSTELRTAVALQEERERADALAELDRAKTDFFSNISHEFRTPLTLLLAPLEDELGRRAGDDAEGLELAHRNAMRLMRLVNTLLDFSRAEAGRSSAELRPTDIATLTAELASLFSPAIERAGLAFDVVCEPLPKPVDLDPDLWERILLNLLSNALKYTFEGSIALRVEEAGGQALVTVADTGEGIPEQELPRLFERFHRVQGVRSRTHEGSGIGLALVHDLVAAHEGSVSVESAEGVGTTFAVRLPFSEVDASEAAYQPSALASAFLQEALRWDPPTALERAGTESPRIGQRILVVDDNADMRDYITSLLSRDYDVATAADGADALEALRGDEFDLVVSDVMMPRVDGLALLTAIREDDQLRSLPVVLVSARAGDEAAVEGLDQGADDYVVKPFTANELVARVRANLELARARNAEAERQRTHAERMSELYVREHRAAETLQRSMLPQALPSEPFLDLAARYQPAEDAALVGGDWYDAVILGDGTLVLTIGDVAGHGLGAAAVMGQLRSAARGHALRGESPADLLSALNGLVWTFETPPMVTCQVVAIAPDRRSLRHASAGHPLALAWRPGDGEVRSLDVPGGPPLGASRMTAYAEATAELSPDERIALHTDGLVERRGESIDEGLIRLRRELLADFATLDELVDHVVATLRPPGGYRDDVALLVVDLPTVAAEEFTLGQQASPTTLVRLRRALRRWCAANGIDEAVCYELLVAVNEAASNSIEHAFGPGRGEYSVTASRDGDELTLVVRDGGDWRQPRGVYRGRGLSVMGSLMDEVDVQRGRDGTVVTMRRTLDA